MQSLTGIFFFSALDKILYISTAMYDVFVTKKYLLGKKMAVMNRQMKTNTLPLSPHIQNRPYCQLHWIVLVQTNKLYTLMDIVHRYVSLNVVIRHFIVYWQYATHTQNRMQEQHTNKIWGLLKDFTPQGSNRI
jgi:hypothetical protein